MDGFDITPAWLVIGTVLLAVFTIDAVVRWWRANAWRRRRDDDDDIPPPPFAA